MYYDDNDNKYPESLEKLTPKYLEVIPQCPSAGSSTAYTSSYQVNQEHNIYTFYCNGSNHDIWGVEVEGNYPQYNSYSGLIPR